MLGEHHIAVAIDVLRIIQTQLHHGGDHVLQSIGTDEGTALGDLLDGEEGGVHMCVVAGFVMTLYQGEQLRLGQAQGDVFLFLDDTL